MPLPAPTMSPSELARRNSLWAATSHARDAHANWVHQQGGLIRLATGNLPAFWSTLVVSGRQNEALQQYELQAAAPAQGAMDGDVRAARLASARQFFSLVQQKVQP